MNLIFEGENPDVIIVKLVDAMPELELPAELTITSVSGGKDHTYIVEDEHDVMIPLPDPDGLDWAGELYEIELDDYQELTISIIDGELNIVDGECHG